MELSFARSPWLAREPLDVVYFRRQVAHARSCLSGVTCACCAEGAWPRAQDDLHARQRGVAAHLSAAVVVVVDAPTALGHVVCLGQVCLSHAC